MRIPRAQWPGMWQPTSQAAAGVTAGTVQTTSTRSPERTTIRRPADVGRHAHDRGRAGRGADGGRLGDFPGVLDASVADDRLVDLETAVDDMQQHGLAGRQVEGVGEERVVLGDQVDLARGCPTPRARSTGSAAARPPRRPRR